MKLDYKVKIAIFFILLIVFFLTLNLTPLGQELKDFFYLRSAPIQNIFWEAGVRASGFFEFVIEMKHLKEENEELKLRIFEILAEKVALEKFKKENEILREALEIGLEKDFALVLAEISKKNTPDFIFINKGTQDGLSKDLPVVTQQKILIGKIAQVHNDFSEVFLISHPQSVFDGKVFVPDQTEASGAEADSEILGVVKGEGNSQITFAQIPKEEQIGEGDLVVTSALTGNCPPGLIVGRINQVRKSDLESFQSAKIQPGFDIRYLEKLFIITEW